MVSTKKLINLIISFFWMTFWANKTSVCFSAFSIRLLTLFPLKEFRAKIN